MLSKCFIRAPVQARADFELNRNNIARCLTIISSVYRRTLSFVHGVLEIFDEPELINVETGDVQSQERITVDGRLDINSNAKCCITRRLCGFSKLF
jgi:hypothetical protein